MEYRKLVYSNRDAIADYLGIDRLELCGGPVRHRECPNCATFDHTQGYGTFWPQVLMSSEIVELTSKTCSRVFWRCPGWTHGAECSEVVSGTFEKRFVRRNGSIRRFIDARDFAARLAIHPSTVRRWVATGKLNHSNGLVPGMSPYQPIVIDSEVCALLKKSRRRLAA